VRLLRLIAKAGIAFAIPALVVLLMSIAQACAHATLVSSDPRDGAVLTEQPAVLHLQFNEPVTPASVRLIDAAGNPREATVHAQDTTVVVALPRALPKGTQALSYRVISADGHPVAGTMIFSIGYLSGAPQLAASPWRARAIWLARLLLYVGLFGGVGGVFFARIVARSEGRPPGARALLLTGLLGAVTSFALQGLELLDVPASEVFSVAPWQAAAATTLATQLYIAVAAMLAAGIALLPPAFVAKTLAVVAVIGAGAALAASGHASSAEPQMVTRSAVFLHGVAVIYWIGALVPLLQLIRRPSRAAIATLDRFAGGAAIAIVVLLSSGIALALVQLDRPAAILETEYGKLLAAKLVLVLVLLALAAFNRFYLTPRLMVSGETIATAKKLGRSILVETLVVLVILGIVASWRFTPPPRALAAASRAPLSLHLHTDKGMVQITISPGRVGPNDILLQFMNEDFSTRAVFDASVALSLPAKGLEGLGAQSLQELPDGMREAKRIMVPQPGRWKIRVGALVTDFQEFSIDGEFEMER
jgi:copper transport protein